MEKSYHGNKIHILNLFLYQLSLALISFTAVLAKKNCTQILQENGLNSFKVINHQLRRNDCETITKQQLAQFLKTRLKIFNLNARANVRIAGQKTFLQDTKIYSIIFVTMTSLWRHYHVTIHHFSSTYLELLELLSLKMALIISNFSATFCA